MLFYLKLCSISLLHAQKSHYFYPKIKTTSRLTELACICIHACIIAFVTGFFLFVLTSFFLYITVSKRVACVTHEACMYVIPQNILHVWSTSWMGPTKQYSMPSCHVTLLVPYSGSGIIGMSRQSQYFDTNHTFFYSRIISQFSSCLLYTSPSPRDQA